MSTRYFTLASLLGLLFLATPVSAAVFPIAELGNCRDQEECWLFCEVPGNKAACWSYQAYDQGTVLAEMDIPSSVPKEMVSTPANIFPITELNNCADVKACKAYCDDSTHFAACTAVAEKYGLTRAATAGQQTALLAHAKEELGCTSLQQCRAYCAEPTNSQQCQAIAQNYGPMKYRLAHHSLLQKAQTILGCTGVAECRALCEQETNKAACRLFAAEHTPIQFMRKLKANMAEQAKNTPPLPCTTLEECRTYCSDPTNVTACAITSERNRVKINVQSEEKFTCNTKAECERYCLVNPTQCPSYQKSVDFKNSKLQQQRRTETAQEPRTKNAAELEKYRRSLIQSEKESTSLTTDQPTTTPATTSDDFD